MSSVVVILCTNVGHSKCAVLVLLLLVPHVFFFQAMLRDCGPSRTTSGSFICVEGLRPSQPSGVMSSMVSLPNHTFTGQDCAHSFTGN